MKLLLPNCIRVSSPAPKAARCKEAWLSLTSLMLA